MLFSMWNVWRWLVTPFKGIFIKVNISNGPTSMCLPHPLYCFLPITFPFLKVTSPLFQFSRAYLLADIQSFGFEERNAKAEIYDCYCCDAFYVDITFKAFVVLKSYIDVQSPEDPVFYRNILVLLYCIFTFNFVLL